MYHVYKHIKPNFQKYADKFSSAFIPSEALTVSPTARQARSGLNEGPSLTGAEKRGMDKP